MPWWVWLMLVLFMLAMIVGGVAYAAVHAVRAMHGIGDVGSRIGELIDDMQQPDPTDDAPAAPTFTQPLRTAADRYAEAHVAVIEREHATRERHARQWAEWNNK
ncbi:hypothetical protein [Bifidobacterium aerophilum]|uniref:Uncharacterized protein n=1 Tax=Bifidobacterium aerophilum TaxID=1798155 RepID=A0A6N9Z478_9BIFI|nr:hypothetical protein [Bifidobacterium aerophilum]NEG89230.1 hypothetical protein [Bifidobacterium aerophilum]